MSDKTMSEEKNERVSWLTLPAEEDMDPDLQKLFAKAREKIGFVPNVFVGYAIRQSHFRYWFNHFREIMQGPSDLSPAQREMISVVVSAENHCLYCLVSHGAELRMALEDPVLGDRITFDYHRAGLDGRTVAMLDYAVKITRDPIACNEADIDHLRGLGFSDEAIFDIAETAAMYNFTNRLASATGMLPNREYHALGR
ncbi:MAG: peroxidase-related enzyme [Ardenticatenaceae bacterium]|nr:peroxidase-related enzyme [Ardenticatenaceae bacterium]